MSTDVTFGALTKGHRPSCFELCFQLSRLALGNWIQTLQSEDAALDGFLARCGERDRVRGTKAHLTQPATLAETKHPGL
jgi:hypothetical protein